ncbi:MAG: hypothetical protein ACLPVY_24055 [Acidimicrobiia bacterium]
MRADRLVTSLLVPTQAARELLYRVEVDGSEFAIREGVIILSTTGARARPHDGPSVAATTSTNPSITEAPTASDVRTSQIRSISPRLAGVTRWFVVGFVELARVDICGGTHHELPFGFR